MKLVGVLFESTAASADWRRFFAIKRQRRTAKFTRHAR